MANASRASEFRQVIVVTSPPAPPGRDDRSAAGPGLFPELVDVADSSAAPEAAGAATDAHPVAGMPDWPVAAGAAWESDPPLKGERVAFTGTLASMTHRQAAAVVERCGGAFVTHVTQLTSLLVIGEEGWPLEANGRISVKLEQAQLLMQQGSSLRLLKESEWLQLVGLSTITDHSPRWYTPAQLSQLLHVSATEIRRWERVGLIRPVQRLFRLPYFDFEEVTAVRRIIDLLSAGVSLHELSAGLMGLRSLYPEIDRPLSQLETLSHEQHLVIRDASGLVDTRTRQRLLAFAEDAVAEDAPADVAVALRFPGVVSDTSRRLADDPSLAWWSELTDRQAVPTREPVERFRLDARRHPTDPVAHFLLADALHQAGQLPAALERYWMAVELDPEYIEAWTQLGCLYLELHEPAEAETAFERTLAIHPDQPEALYHLADLLDSQGRRDESCPIWTRYLEFDPDGPWAEIAQARLTHRPGPISITPDGPTRPTVRPMNREDGAPDEPEAAGPVVD